MVRTAVFETVRKGSIPLTPANFMKCNIYSEKATIHCFRCHDGRQVRHQFCKLAEETRMWEHYPLMAPNFGMISQAHHNII